MIYNKNCGPVAIKTKKTMRLSRGFLAFIFIFGLSAALTAEAGRKKGRVDTTERTQEIKKQAAGKQPTRKLQITERDQLDEIVEYFRLDPSHKAFDLALVELRESHTESLSLFLKDVFTVAKSTDFRFRSGRELRYEEAVESILMGAIKTHSSDLRFDSSSESTKGVIRLLEVVVVVENYFRNNASTSSPSRIIKAKSVIEFLDALSIVINKQPEGKWFSMRDAVENAKRLYRIRRETAADKGVTKILKLEKVLKIFRGLKLKGDLKDLFYNYL